VAGAKMDFVYNALMYVLLFVILKTIQIVSSFAYTTYKSVTFHKNWSHAFNPGLGYRLRSGLYGDIAYFIAGILIAFYASDIRALI
jgi:hypothetical protein